MLLVCYSRYRPPYLWGNPASTYICFCFVNAFPLILLDLLPAKNGEEATMQFLLELVDILTNYVRKTFDRSTKVLDFHHPHQLLEGMEGFNLELSDQPESLEQILVDCRDTLKYGVRTGIYNRLLNWPQLSYMKQATALNQTFPIHAFRTVCVH